MNDSDIFKQQVVTPAQYQQGYVEMLHGMIYHRDYGGYLYKIGNNFVVKVPQVSPCSCPECTFEKQRKGQI